MNEIVRAARVHTWPARALTGDYLRAGAGLAVTAGPMLVFAPLPAAAVAILGALAALFAWLGLRTLRRQFARIEVDDDGICTGSRTVAWNVLTRVRARRFGRRQRDGGYVEIMVAGPGARITVDSGISDFLSLARAVHSAAKANGLAQDAHTRAAFAALGLET